MYDLTGLMITGLLFVGIASLLIIAICGLIAICKNIKRLKHIDKKLWRVDRW